VKDEVNMSDELNKNYRHKIMNRDELLAKIGNFPRVQRVIVCHGVFDVVHPGHIRHLAYAKSKADILVVSLTSDKHITKGTYRPHVPEQLRALSLAAFDMVDFVIVDTNATPLENIEYIKPDFFAKGFEYSDNMPKATLDEMQIVESYGGQMIFTPGDVVYSSTKFLNTHLPSLQMEKLLSLMSECDITFEGLRKTIERFKGFKVHVIGDTIIDTYTRTNLFGGNTKTPTFSVLYDGHDDYVGGAGIVAQHMKAAGAEVTFTTVLGNDRLGGFAVETLRDSGVEVNAVVDANRPTTNKNAIIAGGYRLLKIDTLDNTPISTRIVEQIEEKIVSTKVDCVVFSDFRHGIFSRNSIPRLSAAIPQDVFTVADSQVASRWGNITEFKGFDLVTPNEREARFALADQDSNIGQLASFVKTKTECGNVILKLGPRGIFFLSDDFYHSVDSFARDVKDAVGAGDALLAYATLTMLATKSLPEACIIGAIAAACECEYDGNIPIRPKDVLEKLQQVENLANFKNKDAHLHESSEVFDISHALDKKTAVA
jgi:rfaE bifunctional protein kinase chain/domain/rfaE bifunctional protein nucleotidyltransferase chain/domain